MAKTFNKPLRSIVITTIGGNTINASDTASDPIASDALSQFDSFQTMVVRGNGSVTKIPFHAVDNIVVTSTTSEVSREDPYGCDE